MIYISTHVGKHHVVSEDAVLVGTNIVSDAAEILAIPNTGFLCVADGVGGNQGGAEASHFVLEALAEVGAIHQSMDLKDRMAQINEELLATAAGIPGKENMATTLTGFYISDENFYLIHIGNTRAYIKQGKYLKQVTSDHTTYQWLCSIGQYEAAETCNKNEITNCFGGNNPSLLSKLVVSDFQPFSLAVLTSDGVHEYVDIDTLEEILDGEGNYADKCEKIVQRAVDAGSEDDMTVVVICLAKQK
jgi:protein phosphatase